MRETGLASSCRSAGPALARALTLPFCRGGAGSPAPNCLQLVGLGQGRRGSACAGPAFTGPSSVGLCRSTTLPPVCTLRAGVIFNLPQLTCPHAYRAVRLSGKSPPTPSTRKGAVPGRGGALFCSQGWGSRTIEIGGDPDQRRVPIDRDFILAESLDVVSPAGLGRACSAHRHRHRIAHHLVVRAT